MRVRKPGKRRRDGQKGFQIPGFRSTSGFVPRKVASMPNETSMDSRNVRTMGIPTFFWVISGFPREFTIPIPGMPRNRENKDTHAIYFPSSRIPDISGNNVHIENFIPIPEVSGIV